jgi:transposase-like protein
LGFPRFDQPGLTSDERAELARLRRENRSLREDVDVLKRATAFFASGRPGEGTSFHQGGKPQARALPVRAAC